MSKCEPPDATTLAPDDAEKPSWDTAIRDMEAMIREREIEIAKIKRALYGLRKLKKTNFPFPGTKGN